MLLGIDLGTSAMKVMLFDPETGTFILERETVTIEQPTPELAEADAESWWTALVAILGRLRRTHGQDLNAVQAVGLSTIFPALVPMDAQGAPLRKAILYCDRRSIAEVDEIGAALGSEVFERRTGNQLTPGTCTLPGIAWIRKNEPDVFAATHMFGQASSYLIKRLAGVDSLDFTQASLSGMVTSGSEDHWDAELVNLGGITPDQLPRLAPSSEVVGEVSSSAAAGCGLRKGTPVVAGAGDAPLAAFGGGVIAPHELFCSAGTTDCIMFTGSRPPSNPVFANMRYVCPELWVSIGTMSTAGASVKWLCDGVLECSADDLTEWATDAPVGSDGVIFLPYLQGERTPWWDPKARGMFFGLNLTTQRSHLCRAVLEGVAFGWRQIISLLEEEYEFKASRIVAVGGGSTNLFWNKVKASVLGRPLAALDFTETTSLGAALIGGLGTGLFDSAADASAATAPLCRSTVIDPDPAWTEVYDDLFRTYCDLYPTVAPLFRS